MNRLQARLFIGGVWFGIGCANIVEGVLHHNPDRPIVGLIFLFAGWLYAGGLKK